MMFFCVHGNLEYFESESMMQKSIYFLKLFSQTFKISDRMTLLLLKKVEHYNTRKFDVVILLERYYSLKQDERFTPTKEEVLKAEIAQKNNLNKHLLNKYSTPIIHRNLNNY